MFLPKVFVLNKALPIVKQKMCQKRLQERSQAYSKDCSTLLSATGEHVFSTSEYDSNNVLDGTIIVLKLYHLFRKPSFHLKYLSITALPFLRRILLFFVLQYSLL